MEGLGINASGFDLSTVYTEGSCRISPLPFWDDSDSDVPIFSTQEEMDYGINEEIFLKDSDSSFYVEAHPTFANSSTVTSASANTISATKERSFSALSTKPHRRIRNCPVKLDDPLWISIFKEKNLIKKPFDRVIRVNYLYKEEGKSKDEIAKELNITKGYVQQSIGFKQYPKYDQVVELLEREWDAAAIRKKLRISKNALSRIVDLRERLILWNNHQPGKSSIGDDSARKYVERDLKILEDYYRNGEHFKPLLAARYKVSEAMLDVILLSFNKFDDHDQIIKEYISGKSVREICVINGRSIYTQVVTKVIHQQKVIEAWLTKYPRELPNTLLKEDVVEEENLEEDEIAALSAGTVDSSMDINTFKRRRTDLSSEG